MNTLKLGTLTATVDAHQGPFTLSVGLEVGMVVIFRGYAPTSGSHYAILNHKNEDYVYFCNEADMTKALYSRTDEVVDCMIATGVTLKDLRNHPKADQL